MHAVLGSLSAAVRGWSCLRKRRKRAGNGEACTGVETSRIISMLRLSVRIFEIPFPSRIPGFLFLFSA